MSYSAYEILRRGFKVWYGSFMGMYKRLLSVDGTYDFEKFWKNVVMTELDGIVIDHTPPKVVVIYGLETSYDAIEKLKNTQFVGFRYFTLSSSQFDRYALLLGFKTKAEMLKSLREQKKSHDFFISVGFKV